MDPLTVAGEAQVSTILAIDFELISKIMAETTNSDKSRADIIHSIISGIKNLSIHCSQVSATWLHTGINRNHREATLIFYVKYFHWYDPKNSLVISPYTV
jgi:hypothetical protein